MMLIQQALFAISFLLVGSSLAQDLVVGPDTPTQKCQSNWRKIRQRLVASRKKWAKAAGSSADCYSMTLEKQCFCTEEYRGPHALEIVGGKIQNTTMFATEMPTVEELFDIVEKYCVKDCPSSGAASCRVRFDSKLGYVKEVWIDISEQMADEEIGYIVSDVEFCEK